MKYLSVCSGIEAATQAWHPLGWQPVAFSEIEKFPSAVLAHHYPHVPNWGDMTKFKDWPDESIDLLVGGTPCQSFSVAGLRKGLADPRGNLALTYLAIAERYRPRWLVWENVPGVLSSSGGRDFGAFLGALGQLGYGFAYRVLDAQYVRTRRFSRAVPQRRRRVFVVGHLGDWRRAAAVLFDAESLSGNPPPRRKAGKAAPTIFSRSTAGGGLASEDGTGRGTPMVSVLSSGQANAELCHGFALALNCNRDGAPIAFSSKDYGADAQEECSPTLRAGGHDGSHANAGIPPAIAFAHQAGGKQTTLGANQDGTCQTIGANQTPAVAIQERAVCENPSAGLGGAAFRHDGASYTLEARAVPQAIEYAMTVRRLTPRECERLQGFPDNFTQIPWRGKQPKKCPDGPRYKALGNSMAVNVMTWIGERIKMIKRVAKSGAATSGPCAGIRTRPKPIISR